MTLPGDAPSRAEEVFAEYLRRELAGDGVDFEDLCRAHPALDAELRRIRSECSAADSLFQALAPDVDAEWDTEPPAEAGGSAADLLRRLARHRAPGARYRLMGKIATGGMGTIFKVWDEDLRRVLAMKVIVDGSHRSGQPGAQKPDALERFLEEAQVTGQLDHPAIVPVHELGVDSEGRVFFTMRLVQGQEFRRIISLVHERKEGWNITRALGVLLRACEAVAYAHAKGVIHRDLKPSNIMVGPFGETYVMDWGLARVLGRSDARDIRPRPAAVRTDRREQSAKDTHSPLLTMDGDVIGTPAYMCPEQAEGAIEKIDRPSDVYALGAMLYHLLTGGMPYADPGYDSAYEVLRRVRRGPPPPVGEVAPELPGELVAICEKAMRRNPEERYADMTELAADLRAFLEARPISARRPRPTYLARLWLRRHQAVATTALAAFCVLVLGTVLFLRSLAEERDLAIDAKDESERNLATAYLWRATADESPAGRLLCAAKATDLAEALGHGDLPFEDGEATSSVAAAARGHLIAANGAVHRARWVAATGQAAEAVAFSPDGREVASGERDGTLSLWDARTGDGIASRSALPSEILSVAFTSDGRIACGGTNGEIRLFDGALRHEERRIATPHGPVWALRFDAEDGVLISAGSEGPICCWDPATGSKVAEFATTGSVVPDLALSGRKLAACSIDGAVRIYDLDARRLLHVVKTSGEALSAIALSSDGERVAVGGWDGKIRIHEVTSGKTLGVLSGHRARILSLAFRGDRQLVSASRDHTIRVWLPELEQEVAVFEGHQNAVRSIAISRDGTRLASTGWDNSLRLWQLDALGPVTWIRERSDFVTSIVYAPDGDRIAFARGNGGVERWNVKTGRLDSVLRPRASDGADPAAATWSLAYSGDGRLLVSSSADGTVRVWERGQPRPTVLKGHDGEAFCVAINREGTRIASGGEDGTVRLWDLSGGGEPVTLQCGAEDAMHVAFSPRGDLLASAHGTGEVVLWEVRSGRLLASLDHRPHGLRSVEFSPDGKLLAAAGSEAMLRIWDVGARKQIASPRGHQGRVYCVAFSPDGTLLASGGSKVRLWDTTTWKERASIPGHTDSVVAVAFSPDGKRLASASLDTSVRLVDLGPLAWPAGSCLERAEKRSGFRLDAFEVVPRAPGQR